MVTLELLLVIIRRMGVAADRCEQLREERLRLGPASYDTPGVGAIFVSVIGVLILPLTVLVDYHLLAAPIDYICQLSGVASTASARLLAPIALAVINLAASLSRAQQSSFENSYSEYAPRAKQLNPIIGAILLLQVFAAVAQYVALQAVNPAQANALILLFLGVFAVVTHAAAYALSGNGILLLTSACRLHYRSLKHRRCSNALRRYRRELFRHFQNFSAAADEFKKANPGAAVPELDSVIVTEYNAAAGLQNPPPTATPAPISPEVPNTPQMPPTDPANPYQPVDPNSQRF